MTEQEIINKIKEISDSILYLPLIKYLKENTEIYNYLNKIINQYSFLHTEKDAIYFIKYNIYPYCKTCNKEISYKKIRAGIRYCSAKCKAINPDVREKCKNTCLQKYGVSNVAQDKNIYQKIKNTDLIKYGCNHHLQNQSIIKKRKNTCLQKYGVNNCFKNPEIQEKWKETMLSRYNVIYAAKIDTVKQKIKETNLKRYGGIAPLCNKDILNKTKLTCLQKYGFRNNKIAECWNTINIWKDFIIPNFTKKEFYGKTDENGNEIIYSWKCKKCGNIFNSRIYVTKHLINLCGIRFECCPRCEKCFPFLDNGISNLEKELKEFCKQYYPNLIENNFKTIKPYELDIYIPEINVAIEFNGIYYHSIEQKELGYHLMKTKMCEDLNIRLLHIWEDEWLNNKDEIKQKLLDIFNNKEIKFTSSSLILNRDWYTKNLDIPGYKLINEENPQLIQRRDFLVEDCGKLIYEKIN